MARCLHKDRDLWELLYNGIRHSVANGAEINDSARERFEIGPPDEFA